MASENPVAVHLNHTHIKDITQQIYGKYLNMP